MPQWKPEPIWTDQDAFVIGGGPSLRGFEWNWLIPENTIGCNNAFRLGPQVCKICLFVDNKFIFDQSRKPRAGFYDELAKFPNPVVTNDPALRHAKEPWLLYMDRTPKGLSQTALGYNANCGASALNLALILGAKTVYLLGIDMHLDPAGQPNWHTHLIDKPSSEVYLRMVAGFDQVAADLPRKFPGRQVWNVNADSELAVFPKLDPQQFWRHRHESQAVR